MVAGREGTEHPASSANEVEKQRAMMEDLNTPEFYAERACGEIEICLSEISTGDRGHLLPHVVCFNTSRSLD